MVKFNILILAAGEGTRMRSDTAKVLHSLCEVRLIERVLKTVFRIKPASVAVVVGHQGNEVVRNLTHFKDVEFILQKEQKGSGNAVQSAASWIRKNLKKSSRLLILCGDTPLISTDTLNFLTEGHLKQENCATILSEIFQNPTGYGRILRNSKGQVVKILEEKDASEAERKIKETNSGIYCFDSNKLLEVLPQLKNDNAKKEYYLTDIIEIFHQKGYAVNAIQIHPNSKNETMGINTRIDLASAEKILQRKILNRWMEEGVTVLNPDFTYVGEDAIIGRDTLLLPGTMILGKTRIGNRCIIGPHSLVQDSEIGNGVTIRASFVYSSKVRDSVQVGPFAHLRTGSEIGKESRIGNFTEVKNSQIGQETKISHLSYIGDAALGDEINIGAGVITCNFDGKKKHKTMIGSKSFIGSNVNLIAPIHVGAGSILGAGSTITKDVPPDSLSIERSQQIIKEGWVKRKK